MSTIYVSSYGKDKLKGIYVVSVEDNGSLKLLEKIDTKDYPSYLIRKENTLYASYKNASKENNGGGLGSYSIQNNHLVLNNNYNSSGRSYTHLAISNDEKYLFAANYHVGATASYTVNNHEIINKIGAIRHSGHGTDILKRQEAPHAHCVGFTPDNKYVYSVDLGADQVVLYTYENGVLNQDKEATLKVSDATGPRHMIFSCDGKYAYLINEIANTINVYKYMDCRFNLIQSLPTIPKDYDTLTSAAAIRLTSSGNHLIASNRGHDSLVLYRVNKENGKLMQVTTIHTGKEPRDFNILNDQYVIVGAQKDNQLEVYLLDETNETITPTNNTLEIPEPVCICI